METTNDKLQKLHSAGRVFHSPNERVCTQCRARNECFFFSLWFVVVGIFWLNLPLNMKNGNAQECGLCSKTVCFSFKNFKCHVVFNIHLLMIIWCVRIFSRSSRVHTHTCDEWQHFNTIICRFNFSIYIVFLELLRMGLVGFSLFV